MTLLKLILLMASTFLSGLAIGMSSTFLFLTHKERAKNEISNRSQGKRRKN